MAFHYKDNWFFERIKDGAVRIYHLDNSGLMDRGIAIDAASWASIIASVSARGKLPRHLVKLRISMAKLNRSQATMSF